MSANSWQELLMPSREDCLWELFHENSKLGRFGNPLPERSVVEWMKAQQESLPFHGYPEVVLPMVKSFSSMPIDAAIKARVSARQLQAVPIPLESLSSILHYAYGVSRANESSVVPKAFRTVPSAGALYPLELFFYSRYVEGIGAGVYHYNPLHNSIQFIRPENDNAQITKAFVQEALAREASIIIFLTALFEKCTFKYGERGYRFIFLEAGHVAQNINLIVTALGLASVNIGGFYDREVDDYLSIDGLTHSTIYLTAIGAEVVKDSSSEVVDGQEENTGRHS